MREGIRELERRTDGWIRRSEWPAVARSMCTDPTNRSPSDYVLPRPRPNLKIPFAGITTSPDDSATSHSDYRSEIVPTSFDLRLADQDLLLALTAPHLSIVLSTSRQRLLECRRTEGEEISFGLSEVLRLLEGSRFWREGAGR